MATCTMSSLDGHILYAKGVGQVKGEIQTLG